MEKRLKTGEVKDDGLPHVVSSSTGCDFSCLAYSSEEELHSSATVLCFPGSSDPPSALSPRATKNHGSWALQKDVQASNAISHTKILGE